MNTEEINRKFDELKAKNKETYNAIRKEIYEARQEAINKAEQNPKVGDWILITWKDGLTSIRKLTEKRNLNVYYYFGLDSFGDNWRKASKHTYFQIIQNQHIESLRILTESEVIDFLKQEAEKKYKEGDKFDINSGISIEYREKEMAYINCNKFWYGGYPVLDLNTGEWSEVMEKQEEKPLDIKETLQKYIKHVDDCEGSNFISRLNTSESDVKFTQEEVNLLEKLSEYPAETKEEKEMATCTITRNGYTNIQLSSEVYNLEEGKYKLVKI